MNQWKQIKRILNTFMDTDDEWHSFIVGFFEILCPWPPRHGMSADYYKDIVNGEYHYYLGGRGAGVIAWIIIARLIQVLFF